MSAPKLIVKYNHQSDNLSTIYLAVVSGLGTKRWIPAYRDIHRGVKVVFVRYQRNPKGEVWIMDDNGERKVAEKDILS